MLDSNSLGFEFSWIQIRLDSNSLKGDNISSKFDLEIYGLIEKIDVKKLENLYLESNANGLLRKLQRFNYLKSLLRG